jgi:ATP-binding cassette subfamily F protein uup
VEGQGRIVEYAGGYDDWVAQRPQLEQVQKSAARSQRVRPPRPRKLTFKESLELAGLEPLIEALEAEKATLFGRLADPGFYRTGGDEVARVRRRAAAVDVELETAYSRWEELESINDAANRD